MEEKKKKNKGTIVVITLLILLVLGFGGYFVYDMFLKTEEPKEVEKPKEEVVEQPDFYDVSELVKNNYIEKIETTETDYIKISDKKVLVKPNDFTDKFIESKGIEGTPKYVYARSLCSDCQYEWGYVVLTEEGNVYYAEWKHEISTVSEFEKVNTETTQNIYKLSDVKGIFDGFVFYETSNGELMSVIDDHETFKEIYQYPDKVFRLNTGYSVLFHISPDKKIYKYKSIDENSGNYEEILYNGESIYAKEIFNNTKMNSDSLFQETYIIGQNNKIYFIETDTSAYNRDYMKIDMYNQKEVKEYKIVNTDNEDKEHKVDITYTDGTTESFEEAYVSTLYYRNK